MYDYPGAVHAEPAGRLATGEHALYGWYRCSDGYIFVATKGDEQALKTVSQVCAVLLVSLDLTQVYM